MLNLLLPSLPLVGPRVVLTTWARHPPPSWVTSSVSLAFPDIRIGAGPLPWQGAGPGSPLRSYFTFFPILFYRGVPSANATSIHFQAMSTTSSDTSSQSRELILIVSSSSK